MNLIGRHLLGLCQIANLMLHILSMILAGMLWLLFYTLTNCVLLYTLNNCEVSFLFSLYLHLCM